MAWVAPKIDWTPADGVADTDLNRIEGDVLYLKTDHADLETVIHGAASAATASKIVQRDAAGRTKMAAPAAADDVAVLQNVTDEGTARAAGDNALQAQITAIPTIYVPIAGGTMTGGLVGHTGTDYSTARFRNILIGTVAPTTEGANGDVYMQYIA